MAVYDEKDYIMRMIKEMVRVLFSLVCHKQYASVELPEEDKYEVSGTGVRELLSMVDQGKINEAENILLEDIDYENENEVVAAILFYKYLSEQEDDFLTQNQYSKEEVFEGLEHLAEKTGYRDLIQVYL